MVTFMGLLVSGGLVSNSVMTIWILMEASTLLFLGLVGVSPPMVKNTEVMKLFFIQSFSSMGFIIMYMYSLSVDFKLTSVVLDLFLILKMGVVPFHGWVMGMLNFLSWENLIYLMTILKILPLVLMEATGGILISLISALSWVVSGILGPAMNNLKNMYTCSSLFFMGMILWSSALLKFMWLEYMAIYISLVFPLYMFVMLSPEGSKFSISQLSMNMTGKIILWGLMLNLAGVPPFPGFFLKLDFLSNILSQSFILSLIFLLSAVFTIYMYINMTLWVMSESGAITGASTLKTMSMLFLISLLMIIISLIL